MESQTTTRDGVPLTFASGPSDPYAVTDEPGTWAEVLIAAPVADVWALVSDINLPARFSEEFLGAEWVDDELAVGASFVGRNQMDHLGEWEVTCFVEAYDVGRAFGWKTVDREAPGARWRFDLTPEGDGTRLRYSASMGPGFSFLVVAIDQQPEKATRIIERRIEGHNANMVLTLEGIAALAEGRA
jgi:uncharacterized protein YndB with AHSA1/START domain